MSSRTQPAPAQSKPPARRQSILLDPSSGTIDLKALERQSKRMRRIEKGALQAVRELRGVPEVVQSLETITQSLEAVSQGLADAAAHRHAQGRDVTTKLRAVAQQQQQHFEAMQQAQEDSLNRIARGTSRALRQMKEAQEEALDRVQRTQEQLLEQFTDTVEIGFEKLLSEVAVTLRNMADTQAQALSIVTNHYAPPAVSSATPRPTPMGRHPLAGLAQSHTPALSARDLTEEDGDFDPRQLETFFPAATHRRARSLWNGFFGGALSVLVVAGTVFAFAIL